MKIKVENMLQESLTGGIVMKGYVAVSYTHLTLPTNSLV